MRLSTLRKMRVLIPPKMRPAAKGLFGFWFPALFKYKEEIAFWEECWKAEGGQFKNTHYQTTMLGMAAETDSQFLSGKIVADFGCGPRGSLCWATHARMRIGLDVLAQQYSKFHIRDHNMVYIRTTEYEIPLPSDYVDVLYTLNAMDHVSHFELICRELLRILIPGGLFVGSFNLDEPPTFSEPQTLTEVRVNESLLKHLEIESYRMAAKSTTSSAYSRFFDKSEPPSSGERYLWVKARKPYGHSEPPFLTASKHSPPN